MHDPGELTKTLLARFTRRFNVRHLRKLWESRFKRALVEDGISSRTMAASIDPNSRASDNIHPTHPYPSR